jgi:hypothetical protein
LVPDVSKEIKLRKLLKIKVLQSFQTSETCQSATQLDTKECQLPQQHRGDKLLSRLLAYFCSCKEGSRCAIPHQTVQNEKLAQLATETSGKKRRASAGMQN